LLAQDLAHTKFRMRTPTPRLRPPIGSIIAFGLSAVLLFAGALFFRSTVGAVNQAHVIYFVTLAPVAIATLSADSALAKVRLYLVHLLLCVFFGALFARIDDQMSRRRAPSREILRTWQVNESLVYAYLQKPATSFLSPNVQLVHQRAVFPYVNVVRPLDTFINATDVVGEIDASSGAFRVKVPIIGRQSAVRERAYHLKPWVWF